MSFSSDRMYGALSHHPGGSSHNDDWESEHPPARDWKKIVLMAGLCLLSWVATYVGMLELIEANMGTLPLVHKLIIGFSVGMLMLMVVWLLDEMFKPNPFAVKVLYVAGYIFLTAISVGFGFGFYWKVLESRGESTRSAESAVTQVQGSLTAASARLDQLQQTLDQLTAISLAKAQNERATGTSCPASKPGDGPRRRLREEDASKFQFASEFVKGRATTVKSEMGALDGDLAKIASAEKSTIDASGTRNAFMQGVGRKLDQTVTGFNAFRTDPQLKQIRADLAERSEKISFPDGAGKTFACPDPQLQTALRGVVRAIDGLPELEKPKIAAVEGSEATIEAFRRLVATFSGLLQFKLPPSADELRDLQKKAIQSVSNPTVAAAARSGEQPGLSKRDYIPLAIAVFVDLCLLLVAMGRNHDRLSGLVPKMRAAERGPVIQILSRFNDIHRDRQIRENFDLFRHVVFDFHGDYYVAVPLDAPKRMNPHEREELRLEAQLLSNLFASFEKERIFTRVYSPFLTTGTIRKRLARQGSKFADSDAFRIYRFKDGAWSDIILGAVMGAARRVEAEKRTLALRAEELARSTPLPDPAYDLPYVRRPASRSPAPGYTDAGPPPRRGDRRHATSRSPEFSTGTSPVSADADEMARRFGSYAVYASRPQSIPQPQTATQPVNLGATVHALYPATAGDRDHDLRPANSNTASPLRGPDGERASTSDRAPASFADVVQFSPSAVRSPVVPPGEPTTGHLTPSMGNAALAINPVFAAPAQADARGDEAIATLVPRPAAIQIEAVVPPPGPDSVAIADAADRASSGAEGVAQGNDQGNRSGDWQSQLSIVMTRVTETIELPMPKSGEAGLPPVSLDAAAAAAGPVDAVARQALPAQLGSFTVGHATSDQTTPGDAVDWSETDSVLARRYARTPAE